MVWFAYPAQTIALPTSPPSLNMGAGKDSEISLTGIQMAIAGTPGKDLKRAFSLATRLSGKMQSTTLLAIDTRQRIHSEDRRKALNGLPVREKILLNMTCLRHH